MFPRIIKLPKNHSFIMFGPRGSGKSTFIKKSFPASEKIFYVDLLLDVFERRYLRHPDLLISDIAAIPDLHWVIIDEVQKIPKLLDIAQKLMVEQGVKFVLTGSSARKLKRGGGNLLAGRAFLFYLFPLTITELDQAFDLQSCLSWGTLPQIFSYNTPEDKRNFLISYYRTYLREEILLEQIVRNIEGFRDFIEVAAQMNGKVINFSKISRECGVDPKTVKEFYQILEDTLLGFWVPGFHQSIRKAQKFQPKFYLFDVGVQRAIEGSLASAPVPRTSAYGQYFENYMVSEIYRMNIYSEKDFKISHYQTATGQEIDLILSKGIKKILVEIKSTTLVDPTEVKSFARIAEAFGSCQKYFISQDPTQSQIEGVRCVHFKDFLKEVFE